MDQRGWAADTVGLVRLPSGRTLRGRALRGGLPAGQHPTFGVQLSTRAPTPPPWELRWVRWPDFWLPLDPEQALTVLAEALRGADRDRVEIACGGGVGRTGTALAALAVLEGMSPDVAVAWTRRQYHPHAVEMPWQRRFLYRAAALK